MMQKPIEQIPNTPLNKEKTNHIIKTKDKFIDNDFVNDFNYFLPLSTDDRKHFEINVSEGDLIPYKSPLLITINISKKQLKDAQTHLIKF